MRSALASIVAIALISTPGIADPGNNGKGGGGETGRRGDKPDIHAGHAAASASGGERSKPATSPARGGPEVRQRDSSAEAKRARDARGGPDIARPDRAEVPGRSHDRRAVAPLPGRDLHGVDRAGGPPARRIDRVEWRRFDNRVALTGCPPGLAKKNNGCLPPGQARQVNWSTSPDWWGIRGLRNLSGYRYYDGSLVRMGPGGAITGYYPLLGGALSVDNPWPTSYGPTALDPYYVDYYGLGSDYRYLDNTLYRLNPETSAISSIAALLTGDEFAVGSRIPAGYDVYNVPNDIRDRYVDGPDANYRYSDGYVYQVDPKSQLIVAALQLLS